MPDQICFPNHVGIPGQPQPPNVDGYVEPETFTPEPDFGTAPSEVDTGWTQSSRITYNDDASVSLGRPLMVFQGLKHKSADRLFLSFVVRRDTAFDDNDTIILVFHPNFSEGSIGKTGDERRIDIFPNAEGVGAGDVGTTDPDDFSGDIGGQPITIRANRVPRNVEYYRWIADSWESMPAITNLEIRVRSWDLGENNKNWSVEIELPTTIIEGGDNWIDLTSSFGFYFNVIRLCTSPVCTFDPTPFDGAAFQFTWPRADYGILNRIIEGELDVSQAEIPPDWLGEAFLGTIPECAGVTGVRFESGSSSSIGTDPPLPFSNQISKTDPNTFVARVENTGVDRADNVEATFRIANWGIGPGDDNKWNLISATGGTSNPTISQNIDPASSTNLTMQWELDPLDQNKYDSGELGNHQCIWVLLDSNQSVDFVQSSIRRNMNLVPMSKHEQTAEISGDGYPNPPEDAADQDFLLLVSQMLLKRLVVKSGKKLRKSTQLASFQDPTNLLTRIIALVHWWLKSTQVLNAWVWVMDGYRRTGHALMVDGMEYSIYQPAGSFGYIGEHIGLLQCSKQSVMPANSDRERFTQVSQNSYRFFIPNEEAARIITLLEMVEFRIPWWIWIILAIIVLIILFLIWF